MSRFETLRLAIEKAERAKLLRNVVGNNTFEKAFQTELTPESVELVKATTNVLPKMQSPDIPHRMNICEACELRTNSRCTKTGCFVEVIVELVPFKCPMSKW